MKSNKTSKYFVPCLTILVAAMAQAHAEEETGTLVSGEITPKLVYFNYSGGPGADMSQQLQAYSAQGSWSGDTDKGFYGDLLLPVPLEQRQHRLPQQPEFVACRQ